MVECYSGIILGTGRGKSRKYSEKSIAPSKFILGTCRLRLYSVTAILTCFAIELVSTKSKHSQLWNEPS